ncbi:MAG: hypothetical protein MJY56_00505 [Bacteroidales bacterium]|nr:hypothetical protein [Bacteroidales bacterium]
MKKSLLAVAALLTLLSCGHTFSDELLGNVSDPSRELMSHDFRYIGKYKGYHYGAYNAGYLTTKERPGNLDIDLKISRWKTSKISEVEFIDVALAGDGISDTWRAPYDPTGYIVGNKMYLLYCPSVDSMATYVGRTFDLDRQAFDNEAEILTIDGRPMDLENVLAIYNEKADVHCSSVLDGGPVQFMGLGLNVEIVKGKDCWYCCASEVGADFTCLVMKTTDFYNWETVAIPDMSEKYPGYSFWEAVVYPLDGDIFGFSARFQNKQGCVYGQWNAATGEFMNIDTIPESIIARPAFFTWKGDNYLCVNVNGASLIDGYGSVYRATCRFYRIDPEDYSLIPLKTKFVPEGIHYYTFYKERGGLYMIYSTDSRRLDCAEGRSNIAVERIFLPRR